MRRRNGRNDQSGVLRSNRSRRLAGYPKIHCWPAKLLARNLPILPGPKPQVMKTGKASKTKRANNRKARLKTKRRRQQVRAAA